MKICDITQFYSPVSGGVKRYLHGKIDFLRRETDHRHLLIVPGSSDQATGDDRSKTVVVRSPRIPGTFSYRLLLRRREIRRILEEERPDIIEVGDSYQLAWQMATLGRVLAIPVVAFYHSDYPRALEDDIERRLSKGAAALSRRVLRPYVLRVFGRMDATFVASQRMYRILEEYGFRSLRLVPMGVDTRVFRPSGNAERTVWEIPSDRRFLLYVGRLSVDKNTLALLDMMSDLNGSGTEEYHLGIAGDGPQRDTFQGEAERRSDVAWLGYIDDDTEVARLYCAADMTIHPGTCETYGLTVLESQACGTPAVSVRGGGTDELNLSGQDYLAESGSAEALADCVRRTIPLLNPGLRESLTREVAARFDSNQCFGREIETYREIVEEYRHNRERGSVGTEEG